MTRKTLTLLWYKLLYTYTVILCVWNCTVHLPLWRSFPARAPGEASLKVVGLIWLVVCDRWDLCSTRELLFMEMTSWAISNILIVIKIILFSDLEQTVLMPCCERSTTLVCHCLHSTWITSCTINSCQVPDYYKSNPLPLHHFNSVQMKHFPDVYYIKQNMYLS